MEILIGADPEVFVKDKDGYFKSGHDLIPGTKIAPHMIERGAVQVDGVALEFNIFPAFNEEEFIENIRCVMNKLKVMVHKKNPELTLACIPTAWFDQEYFNSLPDTPKVLGCSPDFNAWVEEENNPPGTDKPFRTGSFHIHIGWTSGADVVDDDYFKLCCNLVRQLDSVLFPASLVWDKDNKRRELYGNMGAFRPKEYGLEYRPLSNAALNNEDIMRWVYKIAVKVTELFFEDIFLQEVFEKEMLDNILYGNYDDINILDYLDRMSNLYDIPKFPQF